jgi:hypothetical protein
MKIMHCVALFTIALTTVLILTVMSWLLLPYKTIDVTNFRVNEFSYTAGEPVYYSFDYNKHTTLTSTTIRELVNTTIYPLDSMVVNAPSGNHSIANHFIIPEFVESGEYQLRLVSNVKVNPLRTIVKVFDSNTFIVLPELSEHPK